MTGKGYEIKLLFAGLHIADVSVIYMDTYLNSDIIHIQLMHSFLVKPGFVNTLIIQLMHSFLVSVRIC